MSLLSIKNEFLSSQNELFSNNFICLLKFCKARTEYIDAMKRD